MPPIVLALLLGAAVAGGNVVLVEQLGVDPLASIPVLAGLIAAPLVATLLVAVMGRSPATETSAAAAEGQVPSPPPKPVEPPENTALRLLAALQDEGRLVDFLSEEIAGYSDQQVGAATRGIHETCRKALRACVSLEPVLPGSEDAPVTVPQGFDPRAVRLTGNVHGEPPFQGTLRHAGWRVTRVEIPARAGLDPHVIAPAEVEIA